MLRSLIERNVSVTPHFGNAHPTLPRVADEKISHGKLWRDVFSSFMIHRVYFADTGRKRIPESR
jgi:hypothetical protein